MKTDWRKHGLFLASVGALYILLVSVAADFAQMLSVKHGVRLLVLLFIAAFVRVVWEYARRLWRNYRALQARLDEARDFLRRYGDNVLRCALTHWLFAQHVNSFRVVDTTKLQSEEILVLDVSQVPLRRDDHLEGMHFAIVGRDGGERAKGRIELCDSVRAHIKLCEQTGVPSVDDLAVPIEPPEATELEQVLGNILFIVRE